MAVPFVHGTEDEFREFGRKHFPGTPQSTLLPPFVAPSASSQPSVITSPHSAIFDIAYNAGFTAGASYGHAAGRAAGYTEGYNTAHALLGVQTSKATAVAEPGHNRTVVKAEEQVYEPEGEVYYDEEEDLGCYSDGAKRTIDDEAVQFYRRSELMQMLKDAKRRVAERRDREAEQGENQKELEAQTQVELHEESEHHNRGVVQESGAPERPNTEIEEDDYAPPEAGPTEVEALVEHNTQEHLGLQETSADSSLIHKSDIVKPDAASSSLSSSKATETTAPLEAASSKAINTNQADRRADSPSSTSLAGGKKKANRGKKRKRPAQRSPPDEDGITYRRIARELDEMPNESVELDY